MPKCYFNKVANNFIEIGLRHGCPPVNLLHIIWTPFPRNTPGDCLCYFQAKSAYFSQLLVLRYF